jgi:MoaA/NifB/PqqE/SkfB family radical SAM enzyme
MKKERENKVELSKKTLFKAIKSAAKYGSKTIHFSGGGEPLLHPNIKEAIRLAKSLNLKVALSTNGLLLTKEIASLIDYPRISLDACNPNSYKAIKGSNGFNKVIENIRKIPKNIKTKIGLGFVFSNENYNEAYDFCLLAKNLGVGFVHIRPVYSSDIKYNKKLQSHLKLCERSVNRAKKFFPNVHFVKEKFNGYWTPRCYNKCRATPLIAVLKANGRFIPCQDRIDLEFGQLNKNDFKNIWLGREHKKVMDGIRIKDCPRCVESKKNEYIQKIFIEDNLLRDML